MKCHFCRGIATRLEPVRGQDVPVCGFHAGDEARPASARELAVAELFSLHAPREETRQ